ncbi:protein kinase [Actinoplanes sp. N902-109]|uniref:protein kinase domain-containing protein n=1 Tax=Actinoplanes sp. (strain N902-109) TaxID=649831 RepID=UPI0003293C4C|nr:protein kinase [Actinoplanes sp. N902-109]AGL13706.1 serine/threonine protein kinase [Actinoplanes sp. N902-109]
MRAEDVTQGGPELPGPEEPLYAGPDEDPDRYELSGPGATGGEGVVWPARYAGGLSSPLPAALKMLRKSAREDGTWWRRSLDQAALLRHLRLEHLVHVHEVFVGAVPHPRGTAAAMDARAPFVAMEWLDGPTLQEELGGIPATAADLPRRLGFVADTAETLAALASATQSAGNPSLHRDIKPANGIVHPQRGLVLIDITTLRRFDDGFDSTGLHTPGYTAPEVLAAPNLPRSLASDMYSLGALAVFCLTGDDPHPGEKLRADLLAVAGSVQIANPRAFVDHVLAALADEPGERPADPVGWARRLQDLAAARPRRLRLAAALGALVLVLSGGGVALAHPWDDAPATTAAPVPTASSRPAVRGAAGTIRTPADRSQVKQCAYFSGTAQLGAGMTLILVMQNLSNNDDHRYAELVYDWDKPATLSEWQGAQYFGQINDAAGQHYVVDLVAVDFAAARRNVNAADFGDALARQGTVLDSIEVTRVPGAGPRNCDGPPPK